MKKTAIITGGSKGIGASISQVLASNGFNLCINYHSDTNSAEKTAAICRNLGAEVLLVKGDISDLIVCQQVVAETIYTFNSLDLVVNNAATTKFCGLKDLNGLTKEDFNRILDVNIVSAYFLVSLSAERLSNSTNNPSIINISSTAGTTGIGSSIAYSVSKGALNTLTVSLAKILAPKIRVNAIAAGFVDTDWWLNYFDNNRYETFKNKQIAKSALNRATTTHDIADVLLFLINSQSITGEIIKVDSGISLGKI